MRFTVLLLCGIVVAASSGWAAGKQHRLVIQVDSANAGVMNEALHNAANVIDTERKAGDTVSVEIVANGYGVKMFVSDLSPVAEEIGRVHAAYPGIVFSACGIALAHTETAMKRSLTVLPQARVVPSGAARIMELEEQGWAYLRP